MADAALRLLFVVQGAQLGGAALHAIDLARRLALRGHHVTATCRPGAGAILRALEAASPPLRAVHVADTYAELAARIDELRPHLVQHFNSLLAPAALQAARHRPRSIEIVHANYALDRSYQPSPTDATDLLVAVSESAARRYPRGARTPPLRVIWNGVDTSHFTPASPAPPAPPVRLLCVGRLDEAAKRTAALVARCADLPDGGWQLTVLGDGPDRGAVAQVVRERGLAHVELTGHCADPAGHYRAAHVYLSYSTSEGFGRALAEAAATGLAILARHCHGVSDRLDAADCARIVHSDDEFARALSELISDAALRARLGAAARRYAVDHLDTRRMVDAYETTYREILDPRQTWREGGCAPSEIETW